MLRQQCIVLQEQFSGTAGENKTIIKQLIPGDRELASEVLANGSPVLKTQNDVTTVWEPFFPEERLIVLGGGHIALPLVDFASKTGFSVTVVDDRPSFANALRFPTAASVLCEGLRSTEGHRQRLCGDHHPRAPV